MNQSPFRLGMIGCGGISSAHGAAATSCPELQFVAACDVRLESAQAWASRFGVQHAYSGYSTMLREQQIDGVILATWPNQHRQQIEELLALGVKNILCEKALTLTTAEAIEIGQLVERHGAFLMEGFMYRHHPIIATLADLVRQGAVGRIDHIRAVFSAHMPEPEKLDLSQLNWRQRKDCGGGVPYDFACYAVNACNYFAMIQGGRPVRADAFGRHSPRLGTVTTLLGRIEYDNGIVGIVESSHAASNCQELQIVGPLGRIRLPIAWTIFGDAVATLTRPTGWVEFQEQTYAAPGVDSYHLQLRNFVGAARGPGSVAPTMPLHESIVNTQTIEALVASADQRRPIDFTPITPG